MDDWKGAQSTVRLVRPVGYIAALVGALGGVGGLVITWLQNQSRMTPGPWPNAPTTITVVAFFVAAVGGVAFARRHEWGRIAVLLFAILFLGGQAVSALGFAVSTLTAGYRLQENLTQLQQIGSWVFRSFAALTSLAMAAALAWVTVLLVRWLLSEEVVALCRDDDTPAATEQEALNPSVIDAARVGDLVTLRLLLAGGMDAESLDQRGRSALHWVALSGGTPQIARTLIEHGASPGRADKSGHTALDYAEESGAKPLIEVMRTVDGRR